MGLSKSVIKQLMKKYKRPLGSRVGGTQSIAQQLKKGTKVSGYMAKDGGYIVKKKKKVVKKRKK